MVVNDTENADAGEAIFTGTHGPCCWLASTAHYMGDKVQLCPEALLGRYLVVTSIDSGSPWLTDEQRAANWSVQAGMAYSPRLTGLGELFFQRDGKEFPGFDEWYLFQAAPAHMGAVLTGNPFEKGNEPRPGRLLVFVNWPSFSLRDSEPHPQSLENMFWEQMDWVRPDVYISDGTDYLTFICRDEPLFRLVHQRLTTALGSKTEP